MTRDPLVIVATLSLAGLAFFLLIEHVPKWARALASFVRFRNTRKWHENRSLNLLSWFAILLSPVYIILLFTVLWALWQIVTSFPKPVDGNSTDLRWHVLALVGLMTALAGLVGTPLALIRVFTTERQTRTQEEGYVTQQINEAVANLAAEKEVNKVGRVISYQPTNPDERWFTTYETVDNRHRVAPEIDGSTIKKSAWEPVKITEPNIEVRIGAILALERLARQRAEIAVREKDANGTKNRTPDGILDHDAARDHVRIMEILCAYIRENAPANSAHSIALTTWPKLPEDAEMWEVLTYQAACQKHRKKWQKETGSWRKSLTGPRNDIQSVLRVLGRRTGDQVTCEGFEAPNEDFSPNAEVGVPFWRGYRFDLRKTHLQAADLASDPDRPMRLAYALLAGAQMQGAVLRAISMQGADLTDASMQGVDLVDAKMRGVNLTKANLNGAHLSYAKMQGAKLREACMQGVVSNLTELQGSDLYKANTQGADLHQVDLKGSNLHQAKMQGAELPGAVLKRTSFEGAQMDATDIGDAEIEGTSFRSARLQGAMFYGDDPVRASLYRANLSWAFFAPKHLDQRIELKDAIIRGSGLRELTLWAGRIDYQTLTEAFGDGSVTFQGKWPDGFVITDSDGVQRANTYGKLSHWSPEVLDYQDFQTQWRAFQATLQEQSIDPD